MADAKVVFFTMLPEELAKLIAEYTPPGFTTEICRGQLSDEEKIERLKDADFILAYGGTLSERVLRSAPKVRLVQLLSAGYDRMDLKLLKELEIPCANNGGANSWAVADHAVLLMLGLYKKLVLSDTGVRENRWRGVIDGFNTYEMANKLVGIIGMGNIGRKVVKRVHGFECHVQYYDKYPLSQEQERELEVQQVSLEELMSTSDIVTMHTPLTPETRHMVGREQLALMKPSAIIINTSRGPVIDEVALIEALQQGKIAGAGLDVFEKEPPDPDNPLLKMDNVIVTPHSAGTTWDTWFRRAEFGYQNIKDVWEGKPAQAVAQGYEG